MFYDILHDKDTFAKISKKFTEKGIKLSAYTLIAYILLSNCEVDSNLIKGAEFVSLMSDCKSTSMQNSEIQDSITEIIKKIPRKNVELSNLDKINIILSKYHLTRNQFDVLAAIVLAEAKANSYEDAYCVINTIYNRTISATWRSYVDSIFGENCGENLYYQATCSGQFVVYESNIYQSFLNVTDLDGYQAVIDFLFTENLKHNFLSFVANGSNSSGCFQFVSNGNLYYNELSGDDKISQQKIEPALKVVQMVK